MRKGAMFHMEWRKKMLNIFADALLIAARFAHVSDDEHRNRPSRPLPHEFRENEGLRIADHIRNNGR